MKRGKEGLRQRRERALERLEADTYKKYVKRCQRLGWQDYDDKDEWEARRDAEIAALRRRLGIGHVVTEEDDDS